MGNCCGKNETEQGQEAIEMDRLDNQFKRLGDVTFWINRILNETTFERTIMGNCCGKNEPEELEMDPVVNQFRRLGDVTFWINRILNDTKFERYKLQVE
ncbi:hypothetical protein J6590_050227 [Homalodisca vitripennis]|nr:hypothetical protein J6590_050227 [Homalodisca vitripennis]